MNLIRKNISDSKLYFQRYTCFYISFVTVYAWVVQQYMTRHVQKCRARLFRPGRALPFKDVDPALSMALGGAFLSQFAWSAQIF